MANVFEQLLRWLREGYPQGIPSHDYIALLGVLHRSLTEQEVEWIAHQLRAGEGGLDEAISDEEIKRLIRTTIQEDPSPEDVRRVASRLAAAGWPLQKITPEDHHLADIDTTGHSTADASPAPESPEN